MAAGGSPVFITHTAAGVGQTQAAIAAGARHATHFYDVFPAPPVTEPGVRPCGAVEAILADMRGFETWSQICMKALFGKPA